MRTLPARRLHVCTAHNCINRHGQSLLSLMNYEIMLMTSFYQNSMVMNTPPVTIC